MLLSDAFERYHYRTRHRESTTLGRRGGTGASLPEPDGPREEEGAVVLYNGVLYIPLVCPAGQLEAGLLEESRMWQNCCTRWYHRLPCI
jgi:hypothetical protein